MFMSMKFVVSVTFVFISSVNPAPINQDKPAPFIMGSEENYEEENSVDAPSFLARFGYLPAPPPGRPSKLISQEELANAIRDFQTFMGLNVTGELDEETKEEMSKPRCSKKDKEPPSTNGLRTYKLGGSRWRNYNLTYDITKYPTTSLSRSDTDASIKLGVLIWSKYTNLTFTRPTKGPAHIEIRFESGEHGDDNPFDGQGKSIAHSFFPIQGGDLHFDDDEKWSINPYKVPNLIQAAMHEVGHCLGLDHSRVKNAVMYPTYHKDFTFQLDQDDITAIRRLYPR